MFNKINEERLTRLEERVTEMETVCNDKIDEATMCLLQLRLELTLYKVFDKYKVICYPLEKQIKVVIGGHVRVDGYDFKQNIMGMFKRISIERTEDDTVVMIYL